MRCPDCVAEDFEVIAEGMHDTPDGTLHYPIGNCKKCEERMKMEKNEILIVVEGGLIQNILNIPKGVTIKVKDYDVEGKDEEDDGVEQDENGDYHYTSIWGRECSVKLKISRSDFVSWYFDKDTLRQVGDDCYGALESGEPFEMSCESIYQLIGYLPISLVKNKSAVKKTDIVEEEIGNPQDYEVEFVE